MRELFNSPRRPTIAPGRKARPIPHPSPTADSSAPPAGSPPTAPCPVDAALIARAVDDGAAAADRRAAFGDLVDRHADRVHDTLAKLLGDPHEASDAAQEAFLKAWRKLNTFRGDSSFRTWLTRIALNAAASRRRTAARRGSRTGLPPVPREDVRAAAPDAATLGEERDEAVRAAVAELAEEFQTVVVLKEFEELSYEEIAEVVGVPIGTVRSRLHRGRAELKRRLAPLLRESVGEPQAAEAPR
ncbi:sigma-70 family RNA polymerase sigma factor [Alienimonas sp. DA493]|uniref:sigma-70 family RNA polymerase sigma factor n=1 Tax=Alienimonas sp. DA493 TaxID=3373605 RepID=UPI003754470E